MPNCRNLICFLSHVFLVYITLVSSDSAGTGTDTGSDTTPVSPLNVISCDASGTINATGDSSVKSVFVECNHNTSDTLKAANMTDNKVTITGCPINKPVKIFLFDATHLMTEGPVVKSPGLLKEVIVVCNGVNIAVDSHFTNGPFSPTAETSIPITNGLTIEVKNSHDHTATNVDIDQTYKLKITGPANMYILVESCDAASNSDFSEHNVSLYAHRSPNDAYGVLGQFSDGTPSEAVANMTGFRLLDSSVVYLRCFVDVCKDVGCPSLTTATATTEPMTTTTTKPTTEPTTEPTTTTSATAVSGRRRRRNVDITHRKITLSTSFRVKSLFMTSRANGYIAADERYVVIASLFLTKIFFDRY